MPRHRLTMVAAVVVAVLCAAACSSSDAPPGVSAERTTSTAAPEASSPGAVRAPASSTSSVAAAEPSPPVVTTPVSPQPVPVDELEVAVYPVPAGSRPHDVAPAADGGVWYTAQRSGALGHLDPRTGATRHIPLGDGSAPHGVIVDGEGVAWVTDGGLNAIVSVDPDGDVVTVFPLPDRAPDANLNTAAFAGDGRLWFTGQAGFHGVLDPATRVLEVFASPQGRGPYGITSTPDGRMFYASLAGSYIAEITPDGGVTVIEPPAPDQGARRVWSDSTGAIWVSEWNAGQLSRYTPTTGAWASWPLPGAAPSTYAVYVDAVDQVWVSDFGGNAIHRFDPRTESFDTFPLPAQPGDVRQILGRGDEIWGAQSADDSLVVIRPAS